MVIIETVGTSPGESGALRGLVLVGDAAAADPVRQYLALLGSAHSRRAVVRDLVVVAGLLTGGLDERGRPAGDPEQVPWGMVRYSHLVEVRRGLAGRYAASSANRILSSVRGVLKQAFKLDLIDANDYQRAIGIEAVKAKRLPAGRDLSGGEIRALFRTCAEDERVFGRRDAAIIAVLYGAGLRREECASLAVADYNPESGELRVRAGKGNKERLTYVQGAGALAVDVWLDHRGREPGALFSSLRRTGRLLARGLTPVGIAKMLARRAAQAGVREFSPHDLRRTFAGDLLDAGADISAVQQLLGHASVTTTQRYDRRGERAKRKAASMLHVPFSG